MQYYPEKKAMILPEYGRNVQSMVDHCLEIEDKAERTRCAQTIIAIMGNLFPHLRDVEDFKHKLWDHLAIMSDFKLDIDYPYEIIRKENLITHPDKIDYSLSRIRYRHYGKLLEQMIAKGRQMEDGPAKTKLFSLIANHMKRSYLNINKEGEHDNEKILKDITEYTHGEVRLDESVFVPLETSGAPVSKNNAPKKKKNTMRRAVR